MNNALYLQKYLQEQNLSTGTSTAVATTSQPKENALTGLSTDTVDFSVKGTGAVTSAAAGAVTGAAANAQTEKGSTEKVAQNEEVVGAGAVSIETSEGIITASIVSVSSEEISEATWRPELNHRTEITWKLEKEDGSIVKYTHPIATQEKYSIDDIGIARSPEYGGTWTFTFGQNSHSDSIESTEGIGIA